MKIMKKTTVILFGVAMALVACNKEDQNILDNNELKVTATFPNGGTRATASAFENGDAISLFAVEHNGETPMPLQVGGNFINNERLAFNGSSWTAARTLYWSDKTCDFYGLYPYVANLYTVEEYPIEVACDQSGDGYERSDILYACTQNVSRSAGSVNLQFKHVMSKLIVNIEKGPKFEGEIPDDIVAHVYNTNVNCKLNMQKGSVEKEAFGAKKTITMNKISNEKFQAVLVPQNLEKRTPLIELTMGGIAYLLEYSLSFRAGYVHTVTVTLNTSPDQEQIEIAIDPSVDDWQ